MAVIETWYNQDLQQPVKVHYLDGSMFSHNGNGNRIGVHVFNNGASVTLSGTVSGYVVTSDGSTVPCTGARSGNAASILIPAAAYQPGAVFITVFLTDGSTVTTLASVATNVMTARTNIQIDPGSVVTDWTQTINAAMQAVVDANAANMATPYDGLTYPVPLGKYTLHDNLLYRCISPIASSEAWTASHWTRVKLGDDVTSLANTVAQKANQSDLTILANTVAQKANQSDLTSLANTVAQKADQTEVTDLKSAIGELYTPSYQEGTYANVNGTAVLRTFSPYSVYKSIKFDISGYESIIVKTYAGSSMPILLVKEDLSVLAETNTGSSSATTLSTVVISTIPTGSKYLLVPCYSASGYDITLSVNVRDEIDKSLIVAKSYTDSKVDNLQDQIDETNEQIGMLFAPSYSAGHYARVNGKAVPSSSSQLSAYKHFDFICAGYTTITVKTYYSGDVAIFVTDKEYNILSETFTTATSATTLSEKTISIPANGYYLLVPCYDATGYNAELVGVDVRNEINKAMAIVESNDINGARIIRKTIETEALKDIEHYSKSNFLNKDLYVENAYVGPNGVITPTTSSPGYTVTGKVYLDEETAYYYKNVFTGYYAFFDENDDLIPDSYHGADNSLSNPFTTPAGTAYALFTIQGGSEIVNNAWVFTQDEKPVDYSLFLPVFSYSDTSDEDIPTDYTGDDICVFRKCLCIGDSYTEGGFNADGNDPDDDTEFEDYSYPTNLARMVGFETTNMGHGGETAVNWYNTYGSSIPSGHDMCVIFLGINDCVYYGSFGDASKTALGNIISKVEEMNNHIKIFVCTIPRTGSLNTQAIRDSAAIIKNYIAGLQDDDVYVLDLDQYGHLGDATAYNYGHPTAYGYHVLANDIKNYVSWIMNNNKNDFRWIQFIGTNKTHDTPM